jgi:general secretion pathway protein D
VPRINVNGNVLLDIEQEISNVAANSSANTLTPTVSQRKVKSSIGVASGQTVLLAGLISERQENDQNSIPFLDQLGELGKTLGHTTKATQRTELIIFIRPQIIRDGLDASRIAEELRSKMRGSRVGSSELLKLPQLPPPPRAPAPPPNPLLVAPAPATPLTPPGAPLSVRN